MIWWFLGNLPKFKKLVLPSMKANQKIATLLVLVGSIGLLPVATVGDAFAASASDVRDSWTGPTHTSDDNNKGHQDKIPAGGPSHTSDDNNSGHGDKLSPEGPVKNNPTG